MKTNHRRDHDAPASQRAYERMVLDIAHAILNVDLYCEQIQEARPTLTRVLIKCDPDDEMGVLVIGTGYEGSLWLSCFHRDITIAAAITGFGNRLRNGSLKWKEDSYLNDNKSTD